MAKVSLTTIKNWFKTGLRPTQEQFWATWDSFFHKDDKIPIAQIDGIQNVYDSINGHINNLDAHMSEFQNMVSNQEIGLSWSKKPEHVVVDNSPTAFVNNKYKLIVTLKPELFAMADKVEIYIDRYRPKRKIRTANRLSEDLTDIISNNNPPKFKESGWKHPKTKIGQPTKILLLQPKTILDFGQQNYFKSDFRVKGMGVNNIRIRNYLPFYIECWIDLSFRILVTKNNKVYESRRSNTLRMTYKNDIINLDLSGKLITYSYK